MCTSLEAICEPHSSVLSEDQLDLLFGEHLGELYCVLKAEIYKIQIVFLFFASMPFLDINIFFFLSWLTNTHCSSTNHYFQEGFPDTLSLHHTQLRCCSCVLSLLTFISVPIMLYYKWFFRCLPCSPQLLPLGDNGWTFLLL